MSIPQPICMGCTRFHRHELGWKCDAFPDGIPDIVAEEGDNHDKPIPGDHGLLFDPLPGASRRSLINELFGDAEMSAAIMVIPQDKQPILHAGVPERVMLRSLLERHASDHDVAKLAGALPDGHVHLHIDPEENTIKMRVHGPFYHSNRTLGRDSSGDLFVHNEGSLHLAQGHNLGTRRMAEQVKAAQNLGVNYISATPERSDTHNGYHHLPILGFDGPLPDTTKAKLTGKLSDANSITDLLRRTNGGDDHGINAWQKHGQASPLRFDLTPGSPSLHAWTNYLAERRRSGASFPAYPSRVNFSFPEHRQDPYPEEPALDWNEEHAAKAAWRRYHENSSLTFPATHKMPSATSGATDGFPPSISGETYSVFPVRTFSETAIANLFNTISDVSFDASLTPAVSCALISTALTEAVYAVALEQQQDPDVCETFFHAAEALFANLIELNDAASIPFWSTALASALFLALADPDKFGQLLSESVKESAPGILNVVAFASAKEKASVASFLNLINWLEPFLAGHVAFSIFPGVLLQDDAALLLPVEFAAPPRPGTPLTLSPTQQRPNPTAQVLGATRGAFPSHLQKKVVENPSGIRRAPSGTIAVTKPRLADNKDMEGATPRSNQLADQIRRHIRRGKVKEHTVQGIQAAVSSLKPEEAKHVHKVLVKGGKAPADANEAGNLIGQAMRRHGTYGDDPPSPMDRLKDVIASYREGDQHLTGLLAMAKETSLRRQGFALAANNARTQLDKLLATVPPMPTGTNQYAGRQTAMMRTNVQVSLRSLKDSLEKITASNEHLRKALVIMIRAPKPLMMNAQQSRDVPKVAIDAALAAIDFVRDIANLKPGETGQIRIDLKPLPEHESRPWVQFISPGISALYLGQNTQIATVVHLLGHVLEDQFAGLKALCKRFAAMRFGKEPFIDMGEIPNLKMLHGEMGRRDNFDLAFAEPMPFYVGKANESGNTEILSMALELLYHDPMALARDAELFKFTVGVLKGDIR